MNRFTHLHLHSDHSLLDGTIKAEPLMQRCRDLGMKSTAVTDHGSLGGIWEMHTAAKKYGVNYIPGVEAYIVPHIIECRGGKWANKGGSNHIVLLAMDNHGYKNLVKIMNVGFNEGFYTQPRIDHKLLEKHSDGIICLSACLGSELADAHRAGEGMGLIADRYRSIFGDRYFLEIQLNGEPDQAPFNDDLIRLSRKMGIPTVATNDCHYLQKDHWEMQDVNFCLGMNKLRDDEKRHRFIPKEYSVETPDEVCEAFATIGQRDAALMAAEIGDNCKVDLTTTTVYLPSFAADGESDEAKLRRLARAGLEERFEEVSNTYLERLDFEFQVIEQMGYSSYFLVVLDYIQAAKQLGIRVGPGRGSGAGSLVAYACGITDVDPIRYELYFERFLNPHRVGLPDFDTDFAKSRRDELIGWIKDKYGEGCVAQIGTQSVFKPKGLVRDVSRVLGHDATMQSNFAATIPGEARGGQGSHGVTLSRNIEYGPDGKPKRNYCHLDKDFKTRYETDPSFREVCNLAEQIESLRRHTSVHASGVIIHDEPLTDLLPLGRVNPRTKVPVSAWNKDEVEEAGFVKYDLLGLAALDVIEFTIEQIRQSEPDFSINSIDLDDGGVYKDIFDAGNSYGVFQFEQKGMRDFGKAFRPRSIDDLSTILALYRPGPLDNGMVREILDVRKGKHINRGWTGHPVVAEILKNTDGVMVYQEQIIKIAVELAGFSLADGDVLRKAMGKKLPEVMAKLEKKFVEGGIERGHSQDLMEEAYADIYRFSDYCFNKAHSVCYALLAFQTAYLKHYYPAEFLAAMMTTKSADSQAIQELVSEADQAGIAVKGPNINDSEISFKATSQGIVFGLGAIKGIGPSALAEIFATRRAGAFLNIYNFVKRVHLGRCKANSILTLIHAGAFDGLGHTRAQLEYGYQDAIAKARQFQKDRKFGQTSLLGAFEDDSFFIPPIQADEETQLMNEREALGLFLSGHPLDRYESVLRDRTTLKLSDIADTRKKDTVIIGGIVNRVSTHNTKRGMMAFTTIADKWGSTDVTFFSNVFARHSRTIVEGEALMISGEINEYRGSKGIVGRGVLRLEDLLLEDCASLEIQVQNEDEVRKLAFILKKFEGDGVPVRILCGSGRISLPAMVTNANELKKEVRQAIPTIHVEARY